MKYLFYFLSIFLAINVYGQDKRFSVGVEGSPSLNIFWGNQSFNTVNRPRLGFNFGLKFQYRFSKVFSFRTGLDFERKCMNAIYYPDYNAYIPEDIVTQSNFDYLTIPVLVQAAFGKRVKFFVNTGAFVSYLLNENSIYGMLYKRPIIDQTSHYKRFDGGVSMGIGLEIPIKKMFSISIEIRNNLGLYNITKPSTVVVNAIIRTNSTNFLLGFNYKFCKTKSAAK